jgi:hypothetical protein
LDHKKFLSFSALGFIAFALMAHPAIAQPNPAPQQSAVDGTAKPTDAASLQKVPAFGLRRVEFLSADSISHFRYVDTAPGQVSARDLYYKFSTRVQFNLAGDGSTYLQARGESGRSFAASYDYTGIGKHDAYWSFNLKSLYLGQKIGKRFEMQAGGVEFDRGAGSEATYADNDGWLEGYRLMYSPQHHNFPDKVSPTVDTSVILRNPTCSAGSTGWEMKTTFRWRP